MVTLRQTNPSDLNRLADWNRQLQEDENSVPMDSPALAARLGRWLQADYTAVIFEDDCKCPVGYALYRPGDPDQQGPNTIYLRQLFIAREHRRQKFGTAAFQQLRQSFPRDSKIILEVLSKNPRGHRFWQSVGFENYSTTYHLGTG